MLQEFPEHSVETVATPSADHLFKVRNERKTYYLTEEQAQTFHHTVSQLLLVSVMSFQYIQIEVVFITTHVKKHMRKMGKTQACVEISQGNKGTETRLKFW